MKKFTSLTFFALFLVQLSAYAVTTSWTGTVSKDWSKAGNWTFGVPTATVDVIIGDANFTGANQPDLAANSFCKSLTIGMGSKVSNIKVDQTLTVSGDVIIGTNGTITHTSRTMSLTGNWMKIGAYIASGNGTTVTFSGTTQSINGTTTFRKLTINASSTTVLNANVTVVNQLTVSGRLDPNETPTRAVAGAGKLVVSSGGRLQVNASTFAGNYGLTGAKTLNAGSTVDYAALTVDQTINNTFVYGTLRISGAMSKTLPGNLPALASSLATSGNILVEGGVLDLAGFTANRGTSVAGGTLSVANGATLKIGGTNSVPTNYRTHTLGVSSTVEYSGTNQSVGLESYGNLTLSTSGGAVTKTLPTAVLTIAGNLTSTAAVGSSVSFTALAPITVRGSLSLGQGTIFNAGAFAHSVGANWTGNGTFNGGSGQITLTGSGSVVSGAGTNLFNDLVITGAGVTAAPGTDLSVAGNFSTTGIGSFTHNPGGAGRLTMSGSGKSISGNGIALNHLLVTGSSSTASSISIGGDLTVNGSLLANAGTITLNGPANTLGGTGPVTFNGLNVSGGITTGRNFIVTSDLSALGSLTATAGTATFAGSSVLSGTANLFNVILNGSRLQLGAGSVLGLRGALTLSAGVFDATTGFPNTVNYNAIGPQAVVATSYGNLVFSGNGTKTASGALVVLGSLTIGSGTTFAAGSFVHSLEGDWINQGPDSTLKSGIQLRGDQDASLSGPTVFGTLIVSKSGAGRVVSLADNVTVDTLNITNTTMLTGTNTVTITSDRTGNGIILGTIKRTHPFTTGVAYAFESPFNTISFTSGNGITNVTVSVVLGPVRDFPFGGSINRQYTVTLASASPYSATLRLHYLDSGLNANTDAGIRLWRFTGGWAVSGKTANDPSDNWVEQSSLTNITGRWTLSDDLNVVRWTGQVSSAWENATNWITAQGSPQLPPSTNDIVELAAAPFSNQPFISTPVSIRILSFGSAQAINLTLDTGGSLVLAGNSGNITANWTNDVTHTIEVGAQVMRVGGVFPLSDGTNGHDIYLDIGSGTVSVADQFTLSGSSQVTFTGSGRLELGGDFIHADGTFTPGTGTVNYNGAGAQAVAGGISYHNLTLSKTGGTATLLDPAIVEANLILTNAGTFLVKAPLTVTNQVVIGAGTTLNGESSTLEVGGNWSRIGAFDPATGTVVFNGTGLQSIAATTFNHLTVNKASGTATLAGNLMINGDLSVAAGVLDLATNTANRSSYGGAFTLAAGSTLKIGSGSSFPASFAARSLANSSTVEYAGTGPQIVSENAYGNLAFSNGGANAKALAGDTSTAGDLVINSGATFLGGTFALNVQGNWINNGSFVPSVGLVTLSGEGKTLSGPTMFNQLTVSGSYTTTSNIAVTAATRISGTLSAGETTNTFAGDFSNTGAFNSSGTVIFTGVGPQLIELGSGFVSSGTVNFNGTVAPDLIGSQPLVFQKVSVNNTGGIAPAVEWTVNGDFAVGPGATFSGGLGTHTFKGSFNNTGTVTSSGTLGFLPSEAATLNLNGASFASTGTAIFGGSGQITFGGGALTLGSVTIANTHPTGVIPVANWTVNENLQIEAGAALNAGNGLTLTLFGDWSNEGIFAGGNSVVVMNGTTDIAGAGSTTFHHLTILGTVAALGDFNVSGNFTNNAAFDGTGSTVTFVGSSPSILGGSIPTLFDSLHVEKTAAPVNLAISLNGLTDLTISGGSLDLSAFGVSQDVAGGTLTMGPGALLRIGGASTLPLFDVNDLDPASTVEYYGTGTQPIAAVNYGNLTSSSTGSRVLASGTPIGIAGVFAPGANAYTITGSTIDFNGAGSQTIPAFNYNNLVSSLTGARVLAPSGTIRVAGTFTPGTNTYTVTNSTIHFNGAAQSIPPFTYFNLATSGSGAKTLGGNILVNGALSLSAALADGGFTATVQGNSDNDATHTGTGKILLVAGSQEHALSGSGSYNNLELNDPSGATLTETNLTVTGTLTFTSGNITTTTNKVIISPAGSVARTSGHVVGRLQKSVPTGPKVTNTFEIGDVSRFAPVTLVLTNVTVTGNVTASTTPGAHPDITNSVVSATRGVNRYWTMTNSNTLFSSYDARFNFVTSDVDFGANPANFIVGKKDGSVWTLPTVSNPTATNILATRMINFSDYVVGEHIPAAAPTITTQPQSQNVSLGGTATFSVEATGTGTLTYQWLFNGNPIAGAINSTLVITNVQSSHAGSYSVIIDNGSLSTSAAAVLTLNQPPTFTAIQIVNGNIEVIFGGIPGGTYSIEATQNLNPFITWTPIATNLVADVNGLFKFVDTQARSFPMRFFRARTP